MDYFKTWPKKEKPLDEEPSDFSSLTDRELERDADYLQGMRAEGIDTKGALKAINKEIARRYALRQV